MSEELRLSSIHLVSPEGPAAPLALLSILLCSLVAVLVDAPLIAREEHKHTVLAVDDTNRCFDVLRFVESDQLELRSALGKMRSLLLDGCASVIVWSELGADGDTVNIGAVAFHINRACLEIGDETFLVQPTPEQLGEFLQMSRLPFRPLNLG